MKVLLLIDSLGSGGAQRQISLLAAELKRRGWAAEVLVYHPEFNHFGDFLKSAGVRVHRLTKRSRFSVLLPLQIAWCAMQEGYDVILAFLPTPTIYAGCVRLAGGPPFIASERFAFTAARLGCLERLTAQMQRFAELVICNSHHHREDFVARFPWLQSRTVTVYNGVDLSRAPAARTRPAAVSLLALGSVVLRKNPLTLVEALGRLRATNRAVPLVRWAGKFADAPPDDLLRNAVEARLEELRVRENWVWLGERRDIPELLADCDAVIHPSFVEGFPNAIAEAFAAGRPVLAGAIGDHARLVREGENGFLFDPASAGSIAGAIERFQELTDDQRQVFGRMARETAHRELSLDNMVDAYTGLFRASKQPII